MYFKQNMLAGNPKRDINYCLIISPEYHFGSYIKSWFLSHFRFLESRYLTQMTWFHLTTSSTRMQWSGYERIASMSWIYHSVWMQSILGILNLSLSTSVMTVTRHSQMKPRYEITHNLLQVHAEGPWESTCSFSLLIKPFFTLFRSRVRVSRRVTSNLWSVNRHFSQFSVKTVHCYQSLFPHQQCFDY